MQGCSLRCWSPGMGTHLPTRLAWLRDIFKEVTPCPCLVMAEPREEGHGWALGFGDHRALLHPTQQPSPCPSLS